MCGPERLPAERRRETVENSAGLLNHQPAENPTIPWQRRKIPHREVIFDF
jgi:hypothetical protein